MAVADYGGRGGGRGRAACWNSCSIRPAAHGLQPMKRFSQKSRLIHFKTIFFLFENLFFLAATAATSPQAMGMRCVAKSNIVKILRCGVCHALPIGEKMAFLVRPQPVRRCVPPIYPCKGAS
ncbi:hypothetical protein [Janthinobacterium sp. HLX7-2]|uniref:hypothetical protein n=1 Tax=Janthinobacterium sp. HLX7-2 TaxID=1259331 RepID=UPI003F521D1A